MAGGARTPCCWVAGSPVSSFHSSDQLRCTVGYHCSQLVGWRPWDWGSPLATGDDNAQPFHYADKQLRSTRSPHAFTEIKTPVTLRDSWRKDQAWPGRNGMTGDEGS
jgi:hypothetical protein